MPETNLKRIKRVDEGLLKDIVNRIVSSIHPDKIVLFGSYAYGSPKKESDLDILVIMNSELPRYRRSVPVYRALAGLLVPKDILVYTQEEIEEWDEVPEAFITTILRKGKVLYEKNKLDLVKNWLEKARRDLATAKKGICF